MRWAPPLRVGQVIRRVQALNARLKGARIADSPVFRCVDGSGCPSPRGLHEDSIGKILKRITAQARRKVDQLGGRSLRAGCVTRLVSVEIEQLGTGTRRQTGWTFGSLV